MDTDRESDDELGAARGIVNALVIVMAVGLAVWALVTGLRPQ